MNSTTNQKRKWFGMLGMGCVVLAGLSTALYATGDMAQATKAQQAAAKARGTQMKVKAPVTTPKIIAVRTRHDMCPYCQAFDPKFPKLIGSVGSDSVLFVTLDLSNETTQRQAAMLVASMGLERVWTGDMSNMGTITFVDGKTRKILSTAYMRDMDSIKAAMREAVSSSAGGS